MPPISTLKNSTPFPRNSISPVSCSVCCYKLLSKTQPPPVSPSPNKSLVWGLLCVRCDFMVFLDSWVPGYLSIQAVRLTVTTLVWAGQNCNTMARKTFSCWNRIVTFQVAKQNYKTSLRIPSLLEESCYPCIREIFPGETIPHWNRVANTSVGIPFPAELYRVLGFRLPG